MRAVRVFFAVSTCVGRERQYPLDSSSQPMRRFRSSYHEGTSSSRYCRVSSAAGLKDAPEGRPSYTTAPTTRGLSFPRKVRSSIFSAISPPGTPSPRTPAPRSPGRNAHLRVAVAASRLRKSGELSCPVEPQCGRSDALDIETKHLQREFSRSITTGEGVVHGKRDSAFREGDCCGWFACAERDALFPVKGRIHTAGKPALHPRSKLVLPAWNGAVDIKSLQSLPAEALLHVLLEGTRAGRDLRHSLYVFSAAHGLQGDEEADEEQEHDSEEDEEGYDLPASHALWGRSEEHTSELQ